MVVHRIETERTTKPPEGHKKANAEEIHNITEHERRNMGNEAVTP